MADRLVRGPGGKGSNQAIAARHFGAETHFIACLGDDPAGHEAIALYERLGIATDTIRIDPDRHTGQAVILVNRSGENMITLSPGANLRLSAADLNACTPALQGSIVTGFQLENSLDVVAHGLRTVKALGGKTFLDPAPVQPIPEELYPSIDILKPNGGEAGMLSGLPVRDPQEALAAGEWFRARGVGTVIITLGRNGTVLVSEACRQHFPAPEVTTLDSTGAGDIFSGAFLASFAAGKDLPNCVRFANAAAALSTRAYGVVASIPPIQDVLDLLRSLPEAHS